MKVFFHSYHSDSLVGSLDWSNTGVANIANRSKNSEKKILIYLSAHLDIKAYYVLQKAFQNVLYETGQQKTLRFPLPIHFEGLLRCVVWLSGGTGSSSAGVNSQWQGQQGSRVGAGMAMLQNTLLSHSLAQQHFHILVKKTFHQAS